MLELYWGCLVFGVLFAIVTLLFGDVLDSTFDGFFQIFSLDHLEWLGSTVIVVGLTIFGGTGVLLVRYTDLRGFVVVVVSLLVATTLSGLVYFVYSKPMKNCENSSGFFIKELVMKTGEVSIPVPSNGYGEVLIRIGAGNTNQIAASNDNVEILAGTQVIVTDIREGILYVSSYKEPG